MLVLLGAVEVCGDIGTVAPLSARRGCCDVVTPLLDSSNVVSLGKYPFGANLTADMDLGGGIVFMGVGGGIRIYSLSSSSMLSEVKTDGVVMDVKYYDGHLYVANGLEGLIAYDVSDPTSPTVVYHYNSPGFAKRINVFGNLLFLSDGEFGVKIFDISSPSSPVLVGAINTLGDASGVALKGNVLYVAEVSSGFSLYDVSDPSSPTLITRNSSVGSVLNVSASGDRLFVALGTGGVRVYDISDPTAPAPISSVSTSARSTDVKEVGSYLYVADMPAGINIYDATTFSHVGNVPTHGVAYATKVVGNYLLVSEDIAGLEIYDITDPSSPVRVSYLEAEGCFYDVKAVGNTMYAAAGSKGVKFFTYGMYGPVKVDEVRGGYAFEVFPYGGRLYVAAGRDGGLLIYDTATHSLLGSYDTPGSAEGVFVAGNYAYVADGLYGVRVIDVSNPYSPMEVGYYDSPGEARKVFVDGDLMYVADGTAGVRVVSVADPTSPYEVGYYDTPGAAMGIFVSYPYVFVADGGGSGLRVIDASDPTSPYEIAHYMTPGEGKDVEVRGYKAYVADGVGGMRIYDLSSLPTITEFGYYDTPWSAQSVFLDPTGRIYVADLSAGFMILSEPQFTSVAESVPVEGVSIAAYGKSAEMTFSTSVPGRAHLLLYAKDGRTVLRKVFRLRRGTESKTLDLSSLGKGIYYAKVRMPGGLVKTGVIIVR